MMRCASARAAGLASVAGTLEPVRRLALESHLASCASCASAQARLRLFDVLSDEDPPSLSPQARARTFAKAVAAAEAAPPVRVPERRSIVWAIAAALALVGVATFVGASIRPSTVRRIASADSPSSRAARPGPRVLGFGAARVEPSADAVVEWRAGSETIALTHGSVRVSVPEGAGTIRVAASRFVVVALASVFVATPSTVRVEAGWVRIEDPSGRELARVSAGGEWRVSTTTAAPACEPCAGLLRDAASSLARGRVAEARELVTDVLAAGPSPAQSAEANLLLADAARIEGRRDEAVRRYRQVAAASRGSMGENALYAAAQLEGERGRRAASETLLREYLDRYPHGRFARAAAEKLGLPR